MTQNAQSDHRPVVERSRGGVVIPYNIHETSTEDGSYTYSYSEIILDQDRIPTVREQQRLIAERMNREVNEFICGYYDQGTQATIQALAQRAMRHGRNDIVDEIEGIFDWIGAAVGYYDQKKAAVMASDAPGDVNWHWSGCGSPGKTRKELQAMFQGA